MSSPRVLVVGTTADYIDLIRRRYPGRALFLTTVSERERAWEAAPGEDEEILCDLRRESGVAATLEAHLARFGLGVDGVACFDCESLGPAARLAIRLGLRFPSPEAVARCRDKFRCKELWARDGVPCPRARVFREASQAVEFLRLTGGPVVLKPLTGSGGELVFRCDRPVECLAACQTMQRRLLDLAGNRMYLPEETGSGGMDPSRDLVAEEYIPGEEYSCDFILAEGRVDIIRTARKLPLDEGGAAGTTAAYLLPAALPPEVPAGLLAAQLCTAARALGLERAVCMVDFKVWQGRAYLLELTPRPGGDCLPWLIRQSCGLDMLGLALDFAQGRLVDLPGPERWEELAGLRLFAGRAGVVTEIEAGPLLGDARVREVLIKRRPGHRVVLPPEDYDSRLLGHVVFKPTAGRPLAAECRELAGKLAVKTEP